MWIIRHKKIFLAISAFLVVASIVIVSIKGLDLSIEFTGGTVTEVSYTERPNIETVKDALAGFDFNAQVQNLGEKNVIIRSRELSDADRGVLLAALVIGEQDPALERFNTIGPTIGKELRNKSIIAFILVAISIVIFIALAFRKVSKPVSSWKYGIVAIVTLLHDVIIPIGIFSLLDKEIGTLFVIGLLSILGMSVNDTIVVFDRIRENLKNDKSELQSEHFENHIGQAIRQTMARSINIAITTTVVLAALVFFGPFATRDLALVLLLGTIFGTYSSIFAASPLVLLSNRKKAQ